MNFFDRLLDNFSAKDLRSRVTGVIVCGFLTCAAAGVGLYFLLFSQQEISISGVGSWSDEMGGAVTVSMPAESLRLIEDRDEVRAEFDDPSEGPFETTTRVLSINPTAPSVLLDASNLPERFSALNKFDVKMILVDEPLWRMLWGGR